ncbi:MAG: hypothetical protein K2H81_00160 [Alistipes sp.]|nr:hypothetical protein [Alistipes sp.]
MKHKSLSGLLTTFWLLQGCLSPLRTVAGTMPDPATAAVTLPASAERCVAVPQQAGVIGIGILLIMVYLLIIKLLYYIHKKINQPVFCKNYIRCYIRGELELFPILQQEPPYDPKLLFTEIKKKHYGGFLIQFKDDTESFPKGDPIYEKLAERNGDTHFNQLFENKSDCPHERVMADNFQSMHVTSDADWDEAHPAGTPLDDILLIEICTFAEFIQSNYTTPSCGYTEKSMLVSELTPADMKMLDTVLMPCIFFMSPPTLELNHNLTLEWTTVEGRVLTASLDSSEVTEALWYVA